MMRIPALILLALVAPAAAPAAAQTPAEPADTALQTRKCLPVSQIRGSEVIDNRTIDFRLRDGSVWRNRMPYQCPGLRQERAFTYATTIPQLCNVDIIRVVVQSMVQVQGATCGLGTFERQPAPPPKPAK